MRSGTSSFHWLIALLWVSTGPTPGQGLHSRGDEGEGGADIGGMREASARMASLLARGDKAGAIDQACGMAQRFARGGDAEGTRRALTMCSRMYGVRQPDELVMALSQGACRGGQAEAVVWAVSRLRAVRGELEAKALAAAGMCGMEARNFGLASSAFRASLGLDPEQLDVAWHMGLAGDYGGDWRGGAEAYSRWMRIQGGQGRARSWTDVPRPSGRKVVAFLCLYRLDSAEGGRWGPSSLGRGVGGSEEAMILLSRRLAARGYHVEVYGHPTDSDLGVDSHGVAWYPVHAYPDRPAPDVFVSWRCYTCMALAGGEVRASPPSCSPCGPLKTISGRCGETSGILDRTLVRRVGKTCLGATLSGS